MVSLSDGRTGEEKSIFAFCAELAEAGKFVNLTKEQVNDLPNIYGNKPGVVWNMDAGRM
jgi:hypothetical protein